MLKPDNSRSASHAPCNASLCSSSPHLHPPPQHPTHSPPASPRSPPLEDAHHLSADSSSISAGLRSSRLAPPHQASSASPAASAAVCAGCRQVITDRYLLKAVDASWHEDCLRCASCQECLGRIGSSLYVRDNLLLCRHDYLRLYGVSGICTSCSKTIPAFELVMRAAGNVYHLDCFACVECKNRFCVGDRYYLSDTNAILCEYDYHVTCRGQTTSGRQHSVARWLMSSLSSSESPSSSAAAGESSQPSSPSSSSKSQTSRNQMMMIGDSSRRLATTTTDIQDDQSPPTDSPEIMMMMMMIPDDASSGYGSPSPVDASSYVVIQAPAQI